MRGIYGRTVQRMSGVCQALSGCKSRRGSLNEVPKKCAANNGFVFFLEAQSEHAVIQRLSSGWNSTSTREVMESATRESARFRTM